MSADNSAHRPADDPAPTPYLAPDDRDPASDPYERLVEVMLPSALGTEQLPDVSRRVRQAAVRQIWVRRFKVAGLAAALLLGVGVAAQLVLRAQHPASPASNGPLANNPASPNPGDAERTRDTPGTTPLPGPPPLFTSDPAAGTGTEVLVLRGSPETPGVVIGTEEADGVVRLGGPAGPTLSLAPWTTVRLNGSTTAGPDATSGREVELLEGRVSVAVPDAHDESVRIVSKPATALVAPGGTAMGIVAGRFYEREPEAMGVQGRGGRVVVSTRPMPGQLPKLQLLAQGQYVVVFPDAITTDAASRRRLYPGVVEIPPGECTRVGPMSFGTSGWTIRDGEGNAYLVETEPEYVDNSPRPNSGKYRRGYLYRITWQDGRVTKTEVIGPPARLFRDGR